jgi:hypothetical protein
MRYEPGTAIGRAMADALFSSQVQPSDYPTTVEVHRAVRASLRRHYRLGCAGAVAWEYGEHPYEAQQRMRWVLATLRGTIARPDDSPAERFRPPVSIMESRGSVNPAGVPAV